MWKVILEIRGLNYDIEMHILMHNTKDVWAILISARDCLFQLEVSMIHDSLLSHVSMMHEMMEVMMHNMIGDVMLICMHTFEIECKTRLVVLMYHFHLQHQHIYTSNTDYKCQFS